MKKEIIKTAQNKWFWACMIMMVTIVSMLPSDVQKPIALVGSAVLTSIWLVSEKTREKQ